MPPILGNPERNIIFFGEIGTGKSSAINLLLETGTSAQVSNDSDPCTKDSSRYEITLNGMRYNLWDTRGLGEGTNFFEKIFGASAEKQLKKFLKERHQRCQIDLLVYCVRGSRATRALVKYYNNICVITRHLVAPVVLLATGLEESEPDMEDWWNRNSLRLKELGMEFDDHVCITALPAHPRSAESKKKLVDLVTKRRQWQAQRTSGSYFGSLVQTSTPSASPPGGLMRNIFKKKFASVAGAGGLSHGLNNHSDHPGPATLTRNSSYDTARESPASSEPSSPVIDVQPPTPRTTTAPVEVPSFDAHRLGVDGLSQSSGQETSSPRSSLHSMFTGQHSSKTSLTEAHRQSCTEENEDYLMNELPFEHAATSVIRRNSYATRHGAFGDIWECDLVSGESLRMVAVKAVKLCPSDEDDISSHEKKLRRELKVWGTLRHPNIVPLLGIVHGFSPLPSMISPWFHNGSLSHYLEHHQTSLSEKHRLLGDIAIGLSYLDSQDVIHGDLHSDNVLIDDYGRACLTDFGLSFFPEFVGTSYVKSSICGAVQFADPSLVQQVCRSLDNRVFYPTKPCDVYSFGGLMLHILSGKKPYDGLSATDVIVKIMAGERPSIPMDNNIASWHKTLIQRCWDHEEFKRPLASDLVAMFPPQ